MNFNCLDEAEGHIKCTDSHVHSKGDIIYRPYVTNENK